MNEELSTTLADSINNTHRECMACDEEFTEILLRKCNKARECGIFLIEAKEKAGHGNWEKWVEERLSFSDVTAWRYMKYAKANPNPVKDLAEGILSLKDAMIASGALDAPQGHASQSKRTPSNPFQSLVSLTTDMQGTFKKWEEQAPIDEWPEELRHQVKDQLEPLVKIYEKL